MEDASRSRGNSLSLSLSSSLSAVGGGAQESVALIEEEKKEEKREKTMRTKKIKRAGKVATVVFARQVLQAEGVQSVGCRWPTGLFIFFYC